MTQRVWNKKGKVPPGAVYVGRPTVYGNPFPMRSEADRSGVVEKHKKWIMAPAQSALRCKIRQELKGKDLVCWCAPLACHADTLLEIANSTDGGK